MSKAVTHLANISKNDLWETPPEIYKEGCRLAKFSPKLDVCATHETAKCSNYFGPDQTTRFLRDGLCASWKMDFFMNPPYSRINIWMHKAILQVDIHKVKGLILTYAKTDTRWFHKYIVGNPNATIHFIKGRINFLLDGEKGRFSSPYPSMWIVLE